MTCWAASARCSSSSGRCPASGCGTRRAASASGARGRQLILTDEFQAFRGRWAWASVVLASGRPRSQGSRRAGQRLPRDELPAGPPLRRRRRLQPPARRLAAARANQRIHATTRCRPAERSSRTAASMLAFPPVLPDPAPRSATASAGGSLRAGRHQRLLGHPAHRPPRRGRVTLDEVVVTCADRGRPPRPLPGHPSDAHRPGPRPSARQAMRAEPPPLDRRFDSVVEERDLTVYDRATGAA